jgi:hypothetical protein
MNSVRRLVVELGVEVLIKLPGYLIYMRLVPVPHVALKPYIRLLGSRYSTTTTATGRALWCRYERSGLHLVMI